MGIIKEKLAQIVTMSIVSILYVSSKKLTVATLMIGKIIATSAVVDKRLVAIIAQQLIKKTKTIKGKSLKRVKNFSKAPPSSA